jgi:hypothetical protein
MKKLKFKFLLTLMGCAALIIACSKSDTSTVSAYVGNYVISHAELAEPLSITTVEAGAFNVPAGTDITVSIQTALLSSVNCSSATKSWVELRSDNSMYLSCEGTNEVNAGTWEEVDATTLKLNMNSTAIPSSPTGFVLTATDIVKTGSNFRGKTSVPIPKEMIAAMIASYHLTLVPSTPSVLNVVFYIDFMKQ